MRKLRLWRGKVNVSVANKHKPYIAVTSGIILVFIPLQTHYTIEEIHRIIQSVDRPIDVTCNDFENYICKYRDIDNLLKEYLASCFLQRWQLPTPPIAFIWVKPEHIPEQFVKTAKPQFFNKPCFGSKYLDQTIEVNQSLVALGNDSTEVRKIQNRLDLLRIGLFDLWLANEDRKQGNYNLLLVPDEPSKFYLHAIDHSACFNNGGVGEYALNLLTPQETVLTSDVCRLLYARSTVIHREIDTVLKRFRPDIKKSADSLPEILKFVPPEWQINTKSIQETLQDSVFQSDWLKRIEITFREYLQLTFR